LKIGTGKRRPIPQNFCLRAAQRSSGGRADEQVHKSAAR
jgi:hypothetical protein